MCICHYAIGGVIAAPFIVYGIVLAVRLAKRLSYAWDVRKFDRKEANRKVEESRIAAEEALIYESTRGCYRSCFPPGFVCHNKDHKSCQALKNK